MRSILGLLFAAALLPLSALHADAPAPAQAAADTAGHLVPDDQVSLEELHELFDQAFIQNEIDTQDNNGLKVTDAGLTVYVQPIKGDKVIQFVSTWSFKPKADDLKKLQLVNEFNDKYIFVRYCSSKNGTLLWCDYDLYYGGGILDAQIVRAFREFVTLLYNNIGLSDWNDLVQ